MFVRHRAALGSVAICTLAAAVLLAACSREQLGLPRIALAVTSPDGRHRALVLNHPSIDPPAQSLWVGPVNGNPSFVQKLSEDQDWCKVAVWSAQSNRVAFLVQDARLVMVDAKVGKVVDRWLVPQDGYPPSSTIEGLSLSPDGKTARFHACRRATGACSDWQTEPID